MTHMKMKATVELNIRDFAAFEDLTTELGIKITCTAVLQPTDEPKVKSPRKRRYFVTQGDFDHIKAIYLNSPNDASCLLRKLSDVPCSATTFERVITTIHHGGTFKDFKQKTMVGGVGKKPRKIING